MEAESLCKHLWVVGNVETGGFMYLGYGRNMNTENKINKLREQVSEQEITFSV